MRALHRELVLAAMILDKVEELSENLQRQREREQRERRERERREREERERLRRGYGHKRVSGGLTMTLYHATDESGWAGIQSSRRMKRGSGGMAGGGIYLATTKSDAKRKAQRSATRVLTLRVRLGRVKEISRNGDGSGVTFQRLSSDGYDSVKIPRENGVEYVVYNWDQCEVLWDQTERC